MLSSLKIFYTDELIVSYIDVKKDSFLSKDLPPVLAQLNNLYPLLLQCFKCHLLCHGLILWQDRLQEVVDGAQAVLNVEHVFEVQLCSKLYEKSLPLSAVNLLHSR